MYELKDYGAVRVTIGARATSFNQITGANYPSVKVVLTQKGMDYSSRTATFDFTAEGYGSYSKYMTGVVSVSIYGTPLFNIAISDMKYWSGGDYETFTITGEVTLPYEADGTMDNIYTSMKLEGISIYGRTVEAVGYYAHTAGAYYNESIPPLQQEPFFFGAPYYITESFEGETGNIQEHDVRNFHLVVPYVPTGANKLRMVIPTYGGEDVSVADYIWEYVIENPQIGWYKDTLSLDNEGRYKVLEAIKAAGRLESLLTTFLIGFANDDYYYDEPVCVQSPCEIIITLEQPVVVGKVKDVNEITIALTGDDSVLILNASSALTTITAEAVGTGIIREKSIQNSAETVTNVDEYTWHGVKSHIFYFGAKDSNRYSTTIRVDAPYIDYVQPSAVIKGSIVTGEGNMNMKVYGSYFDGSFGIANNTIEVYYRYKEQSADDSEFTAWIQLPEVEVDTSSKAYSVSATITGLEYTKTYVIQACIVDALNTIFSADYIAASKPIFDWSASDFNFNVPVTIMGNSVMVGGGNEPKILWEGIETMKEGQTIALSEPISGQPTGILLVFDYMGAGTAWVTHYIPKAMVRIYNGGAQIFMLANDARLGYVGAKQLYISDDEIAGHEYNDDYAEVNSQFQTSNIKYRSSAFYLRYVLGV